MKRFRKSEGFTLIELLIVIIIIGILAAIAIPMFLNQRDKAKDAGVKEGVHSIQIGVQTLATDTATDTYPATCTKGNVGAVVDSWPKNPWTGADMDDTGAKGMYTYSVATDFSQFKLVGFGSTGAVITVGTLP
jgi:prepilin-type N-terminal cleavage/methylation domain-containing protein